jgi:hypothetical protein
VRERKREEVMERERGEREKHREIGVRGNNCSNNNRKLFHIRDKNLS